MVTTTTTSTTNSIVRNIYRYGILTLLILLILLVGGHNRGIAQLVLTSLLLVLIVILFEYFTAPRVDIQVENVEAMNNVRGNTFYNMNIPATNLYSDEDINLDQDEERKIIYLPSNQNNYDVPFDMRGLMIKKSNDNALPPIDIDYTANENNFVANNIAIGGGGDRFNYLNRGYMYEDTPGNVIVDKYSDLIVSPKFGKKGYFLENDCNYGTSNTLLN
jgi:hypothetical protein